ncbi:MAG: ABC transporter ATP-binding protein/permease [Candidatus Pacebacteria bacterium]|nr:ABC transporter ATP-binding protein/permease [Candidatus Paceibacterota bacterium]
MHANSKLDWALAFLRPYRRRILTVVILTIILSVLAMLPPLLVKYVIDRVITRGQIHYLVPLATALIAVPIVTAIMRFVQTMGLSYIGQFFVFHVRNALYQHLLSMPMRFYGKHSVGMLVNRLMGDSGVVQRILTAQTIGVLSDLVCASFAVCATFLISWRLALIMIVVIVAFVVNYKVNITRIRDATRSYQGAYDRLSGGIQNRLHSTVAVKTFGTEMREHQVFQGTLYGSLGLVQQAMISSNTFSMNTQLIHQGGHSILYFAGCALVLQGSLSYGEVVAFTAYAVQLLMPAVRFSMIAKELQDVNIATDRLMELFKEGSEIEDAADAVNVERLRGEVEFDHVVFWYESGTPVINDFNLRVKPGMTVALIGPTGCGKSTILSLILRFFDVCSGELRLDGIDIRTISLESLHKQFGIVLQEPLLFSVTIAENIRYGRGNAPMEEVRAAAKVAEIHDFIMTLPDGYNTRIGSEGLELSVGQRQRITIARAVLADPAILIMDEATSSLDSDSEKAVQTAMERVLKNRTCFVVAHRLSTIRNADIIVLLKDGRIQEQGSHDELMKIPDGHYRKLYKTHMGKTVIEE